MATETYREQKKRFREAAKDYLKSINIDPKEVDGLECYIIDDVAALMKTSGVEAKGLANDLETMPVAVIWGDLSKNTYEITPAGQEYFGLKRET